MLCYVNKLATSLVSSVSALSAPGYKSRDLFVRIMLLKTWQRWKNHTLAKLLKGFRQQVLDHICIHYNYTYTTSKPNVHQMYTRCTQHVHHMYITCTLNVRNMDHHMYTTCIPHVHHMYIVHVVYTICTLHVHNINTKCTMNTSYNSYIFIFLLKCPVC